MLITKQGNIAKLKQYIKFSCDVCGCEFIADNTEYHYECNQHDGEGWEISCPCCHRCKYMCRQNIVKQYDDIPPELNTPTTGSNAVKPRLETSFA